MSDAARRRRLKNRLDGFNALYAELGNAKTKIESAEKLCDIVRREIADELGVYIDQD